LWLNVTKMKDGVLYAVRLGPYTREPAAIEFSAKLNVDSGRKGLTQYLQCNAVSRPADSLADKRGRFVNPDERKCLPLRNKNSLPRNDH
jgi:hypothetical protein